MKSVLISIKPEWCEKIVNGKKTIEVRKTAPKEVPFKCYIYETQGRTGTPWVDEGGHFIYKGRGAVIGEFICDKIDRLQKRGIDNNFDYCYLSLNEWGNDDIAVEITDIKKSCITKADLNKYGANVQWLYAWHISDLKIYDKPKELSEFYRPCSYSGICYSCNRFRLNGTPNDKPNDFCDGEITRPPQSYMYVGEVEE